MMKTIRSIPAAVAAGLEARARLLDPDVRFGRVRRSWHGQGCGVRALCQLELYVHGGVVVAVPVTVTVRDDATVGEYAGLCLTARGSSGERRIVASVDTMGAALASAMGFLAGHGMSVCTDPGSPVSTGIGASVSTDSGTPAEPERTLNENQNHNRNKKEGEGR
jgi:hypothetical protein